MDSFYGRPWRMAATKPWIDTKSSGLDGLMETCQALLRKYKDPTGNEFGGYEYVWSRSQVCVPI